MLLNNFRPDKDDRFYFLFRFAVRSWLLFLSVIFYVPVCLFFGRSITLKQVCAMFVAFVLIVAVDFISVWIKASAEYKEMGRVEREMYGRRKD